MKRNFSKIKQEALWCIFALFSIVFAMPANAQTVTVSGKSSGSLSVIGSTTYFATWRHIQAPLSINTANNTDFGTLASNLHISALDATKDMLECYNYGKNGNHNYCYIKMTLPIGYRFTDYHITMQRKGQADNGDGGQLNFYETASDFKTSSSKKSVDLGSSNSTTGSFSVNRQSTSDTDMGNEIYFVYYVEKGNSGITEGITFTSFSVSFAADVDFKTSLAPKKEFTAAQDSVWGIFDTGKLDFGVFDNKIESNAVSGNYGYVATGTKPRYAYNRLYQSDCYGTDRTYSSPETKTITGVTFDGSNYYGLGNNTYFAEVATFAKTRGAAGDNTNTIPVGYRITGAKINYKLYSTAGSTTSDGYTIAANGYYLMCNSSGTLSWASTADTTDANATHWYGDALTGTSGTIYCTVGGTTYYLYRGNRSGNNSSSYYTISANSSSSNATTWTKNGDNFYTTYTTGYGWDTNTYYYYIQYNTSFNTSNSSTSNTAPDNPAASTAYTVTTQAGNYTYTLTVYQNDENEDDLISKTPITKTVNNDNTSGTIELTGLNNDAIKFDVSGLPTGGFALVTVDLTLQPLDPYVSSMSVGYDPDGENPAVTQDVTTSDFSFGDGVNLIIPKAYETTDGKYKLTFSNLKSKYSDNTYYDNTASGDKSRYYFAKSAYYDKYPTYTYVYNNKKDVATHTYTDKVLTTVVGDKQFTFSNVSELKPTVSDKTQRYYEEYEFSESRYEDASYDGGTFGEKSLTVGDTGTYYIFVGDETQYNIAPSIDSHRLYAYYKVTVSLSMVNETPVLTWTPIYQKSMYVNDSGNDVEDGNYFAGLTVSAQTGTNDTDAKGYLLASDIITAMKNEISNQTNNAPTDLAHVLYIDNSGLASVVTTATTDGGDNWSELKSSLAKNALLFLPVGASTKLHNAVAKTANNYKAISNIELTDKQPFFTPYGFTVGGDNYATYTRKLTWTNGKVSNATVILPFSLTLSEGKHTNNDGKCAFTVAKMNNTDCIAAIGGNEGTDYTETAKFSHVSETKTAANEPYYVKVDTHDETETTSSFVATEYGAEFSATPADAKNGSVTSETSSTGSVDSGKFTFTNKGTFCGQALLKTENNIFYFGRNMFYNIKNLSSNTLYVYPFRAYYNYSSPASAKMSMFDVTFSDEETTGIGNVNNNQGGLKVRSYQGNIVISASETTPVNIYSMTGQCMNNVTVEAGQSESISVAAGLYVVNGIKVSVK